MARPQSDVKLKLNNSCLRFFYQSQPRDVLKSSFVVESAMELRKSNSFAAVV